MSASGYPPEVDANDDVACERYIQQVREEEGIELDRELLDAGHNPGLRSIAKLMLNRYTCYFVEKIYLTIIFPVYGVNSAKEQICQIIKYLRRTMNIPDSLQQIVLKLLRKQT